MDNQFAPNFFQLNNAAVGINHHFQEDRVTTDGCERMIFIEIQKQIYQYIFFQFTVDLGTGKYPPGKIAPPGNKAQRLFMAIFCKLWLESSDGLRDLMQVLMRK